MTITNDPKTAALAALRAAEDSADTLRARGARAIAEAHANLDKLFAEEVSARDAIVEAARAKVDAAEASIATKRELEEAARLAWRAADASLVDAVDASAACKARDEAEVAHRKAIRARELAEGELARTLVALSDVRSSHPAPKHPLGLPLLRALAEVSGVRAATLELRDREDRIRGLVATDDERNLIAAALSAATFLARTPEPRDHDFVFALVRGLADVVGAGHPIDLSAAHLTKCLEAFTTGGYALVFREEVRASNEKGARQAAANAAYEAKMQLSRKIEKLRSTERDIRAAMNRTRHAPILGGVPMGSGVLEDELKGVVAELAALEALALPDLPSVNRWSATARAAP